MKKLYTRTQSIFSMKHIWKLLLLFTIFSTSQKVSAQFRMASTIIDSVGAITIFNDTIYIATYPEVDNVKVYDTVRILKWMGRTWDTVAFLPYYDENYVGQNENFLVSSLSFIQGDLYLTGNFDSLPGLTGKTKFLKWDGNNWTVKAIPASMNRAGETITHAKVWNYELWAINNYHDSVSSWDGTKWTGRDTFSKDVVQMYNIYNLDTFNNELYLNGYFKVKINNTESMAYYLKWNGASWVPTGDLYEIGFTKVKYKAGYIYFKKYAGFDNSPTDIVYYIEGQDTTKLTEGYNINSKVRYGRDIETVVIKDKIYRFGYFQDNSFNYKNGLVWDGSKWDFIPAEITKYTRLGLPIVLQTYTQGLMISTHFDSNFFFTFGNIAIISGNVFNDNNGNCIKDTGEAPINNAIIEIKPGPIYINTNDQGDYSIDLDSGKYALKVIPRKYRNQTCPGNDSSLIVSASYDSIHAGNNIAIQSIPGIKDMRVTVTGSSGWRVRQGFTESFALCYENTGTTLASGEINLVIDSAFNNFSSTPSAFSYTYPVATWKFDTLQPDEKRCITFNLKVKNANINDSLTLITYFDGGDSWIDTSSGDNADTLKQRVVASLDPNDKTSYPAGNITQETKELRYQIRFQNTGTDTAYRVTVIDTVDTNLPLTKIMMNSTSHKYKLSIKNNVFTWTFDGIMLPDSNTNEALSHGFINYTAQIKQGLAIGTEIKNTAYIYFDYQKPVITNTARNKVAKKPIVRIGKNKFTGKAYYDINNNCKRDENEPAVPNTFLTIINLAPPASSLVINTDKNGDYSYMADSSSYILKSIPPKYWEETCLGNGSGVGVYTLENKTYVNDFALQPMPDKQDVRVSLMSINGWEKRKNTNDKYILNYENIGTVPTAGNITLHLTADFTHFSASPAPYSFVNNLALWKFDSLQIGEKRSIIFYTGADSANTADSLQITAAVETNNKIDNDLLNNADTLNLVVAERINSNNKSVSHKEEFTASTKTLRYQVRFQNYRNSVVKKVTVIDTLSPYLPITKIITEATSHAYKLDVRGNVYTWTFDNIMLPANTTNDTFSQGFLTYTAEIKEGLPLQTEIKNTAHIFFDNQQPIVTNTTRNILVEEKIIEEPDGIAEDQSISSDLYIFPNPAKDFVIIRNYGQEAKELQFVNILGRVLKTIKVQPFEIQKVQTSALKPGIYFIKAAGEKAQKLIIE